MKQIMGFGIVEKNWALNALKCLVFIFYFFHVFVFAKTFTFWRFCVCFFAKTFTFWQGFSRKKKHTHKQKKKYNYFAISQKTHTHRLARFNGIPLKGFINQWHELKLENKEEICEAFGRSPEIECKDDWQVLLPNKPFDSIDDMKALRDIAIRHRKDGIKSYTNNNSDVLQLSPKEQGIELQNILIGIVVFYDLRLGIGFLRTVERGQELIMFSMHSICTEGYRSVKIGSHVKFQIKFIFHFFFIFIFFFLCFCAKLRNCLKK